MLLANTLHGKIIVFGSLISLLVNVNCGETYP